MCNMHVLDVHHQTSWKRSQFSCYFFLTPFFLVAEINFPEIPKSNQKKEGGVGFGVFFSFYFLCFLPWWFLPDFLPLSHPP